MEKSEVDVNVGTQGVTQLQPCGYTISCSQPSPLSPPAALPYTYHSRMNISLPVMPRGSGYRLSLHTHKVYIVILNNVTKSKIKSGNSSTPSSTPISSPEDIIYKSLPNSPFSILAFIANALEGSQGGLLLLFTISMLSSPPSFLKFSITQPYLFLSKIQSHG